MGQRMEIQCAVIYLHFPGSALSLIWFYYPSTKPLSFRLFLLTLLWALFPHVLSLQSALFNGNSFSLKYPYIAPQIHPQNSQNVNPFCSDCPCPMSLLSSSFMVFSTSGGGVRHACCSVSDTVLSTQQFVYVIKATLFQWVLFIN